jgi:hypothetical protein
MPNYNDNLSKSGNFWFVRELCDKIDKEIECVENESRENKTKCKDKHLSERKDELIRKKIFVNNIYQGALTSESQLHIDQIKCCGGFRTVCEAFVVYYDCKGENLSGKLDALRPILKEKDPNLHKLFFTDPVETVTINTRDKTEQLNEKGHSDGYRLDALFRELGNIYGHKDDKLGLLNQKNLELAIVNLHKVLLAAFWNDIHNSEQKPDFKWDYMPIGEWFIDNRLLNSSKSNYEKFIAHRNVDITKRPYGIIYKHPIDRRIQTDREMTVKALAEGGLPNFELIKDNNGDKGELIYAYTFCSNPYWLKDIKESWGKIEDDKKKDICIKLASYLLNLQREKGIYHRTIGESSVVMEIVEKDGETTVLPYIINFHNAKIFKTKGTFYNQDAFAAATFEHPENPKPDGREKEEEHWDKWDVFSLGGIFRLILGNYKEIIEWDSDNKKKITPKDMAGFDKKLMEHYKESKIFDKDFWVLLEAMRQGSKQGKNNRTEERPTMANIVARLTIQALLNDLAQAPTDNALIQKAIGKLKQCLPDSANDYNDTGTTADETTNTVLADNQALSYDDGCCSTIAQSEPLEDIISVDATSNAGADSGVELTKGNVLKADGIGSFRLRFLNCFNSWPWVGKLFSWRKLE